MWTVPDLSQYLIRQRDVIERAIDDRLPPLTTRPARLHEAIRYSVIPGGKRLRPILCLAAADTVAQHVTPSPLPAALASAVAIELLHTYTLIHDDLPSMDDDALRRGQPTVHMAFGEAMAVLAGDALQTLAFECLAEAAPGARYHGGRLVLELCRAAGSQGVIAGQVEDIAALDTKPSESTIHFVHRHKTALLFAAAMKMGGIAANASDVQLAALHHYGASFGEAFQITDDLLDSPDDGSGTHEKPLTCLSVYDRNTAIEKAGQLLNDAVDAIQQLEEEGRAPLTAIAEELVGHTH